MPLGRPASESGSLRHGDGGHEGGDRRRRGASVGFYEATGRVNS
jgi:hypothetical protein